MNNDELPKRKGRGSFISPPNRFEKSHHEPDFEHLEHDEEFVDGLGRQKTEFVSDNTKSVVTENDSPDIGFRYSLNPYRGCEHGCAYCYARITHEYLGFSAGLDFETKIMVKEDAPILLRQELAAPRWKPQVLALSGVTDPYQPIERRLQLTRKCLAVLAEFRNPVGIVTKNHLVTRDIDLLRELATHQAAAVNLSINSLDAELARKLEPRASAPNHRLAAVEALAKAGIPAGVLVAPVIPGLNDHEIPSVLSAAKSAGAKWAGLVVLRLPLTVAPVFQQWLEHHAPEKMAKVLGRIRAIRGGKLNDPRFGSRMRGDGIFADQISRMFQVARRRAGLPDKGPELSAEAFRRPAGAQLEFGL